MIRTRVAVGLIASFAWVGAAWSADVEHKRGDFRFFVGDAPAFVVGHEIPAHWDPKAPGVQDPVWRAWLFDEQIDRRKGVDAMYIDYAYEPRNVTNLGDAGRYQIVFNPEYQKLALHRVQLRREGAWQDRLLPDKITLARRETEFEQDMADGQVTALIVLDDVRIGDVVRITYTITGSNPILAGQTMDAVTMAWQSPVQDVHMRVLYDAGTKVKWNAQRGAKAPVVREGSEGVEARVDAHGMASVVDEGDYPVWYDPWPTLQVAPARTWAEVVAWALPLYPTDGALPADLKARIATWKQLPDANARLRAALHAVQDEVRYFGVEMGSSTHRPAPPATTWERRYGDCKDKTQLLAAILRELDIEAVPALVSTSRGRALLEMQPTAAAFNHVIVRATLDGKHVFVDPTITQQGGNPVDVDFARYGVALPVLPGTTALEAIAVPARADSAVSVRERFAPQGEGERMRYEIETTYRGESADFVRRSVAAQRGDDLARRYADYYRKRYGELDVVDAPTFKDDRNANTVVMRETYLLHAPFEKEGTSTRALDVYALALGDATEEPRTVVRKGPLAVGQPSNYRHDIEVVVPKGWRPTFGASHEKVDTGAYAFGIDVDRGDVEAGGTVKLAYTLAVKEHELDPTRANAHVLQLRKVRDLMNSRLRFAAPIERMGAKERDDRLKNLLRDVMEEEEKGTQ
jgi:hypothetical protein